MNRIAMSVAAATLLAVAEAGISEEGNSGGLIELGLHAWTFRHGTFMDAVDEAARAGIRCIEAFPGQAIGGGLDGKTVASMGSAVRESVLARLRTSGVRLASYGVVTPLDEKGWQDLFEFARAMGIRTLVSEPAEEQMDLVERLCDEYRVNVAIHNHPRPSRYWNPETVLAAVSNRSARIGVAADTGHWIRSGLDPVESLRKVEGRLMTLHLKDVDRKAPGAVDVPWGTGIARVASQIAELKRQGFTGTVFIEYEDDAAEQSANVALCAGFFRTCAPAPAADRR